MNKKLNKVTNEQGFTFEIDQGLTDLAHSDEGHFKKVLPDKYIVLEVTKDNIHKGFVLYDINVQRTICEKECGAEEMATYLTMLKSKINMEK